MINSISNKRIKHVTELLTKSKIRREEGMYVIEGERMCAEAPRHLVKQIYVSGSFLNKIHSNKDKYSDIISLIEEMGCEEVTDSVFERMSDTKTPQGIMCVMKKDTADKEFLKKLFSKERIHILALEGLQDPGNMGTIMRTAEGAGYDLILADEKTVDIYNPKVIRSTMGGLFRMKVLYTKNLAGTLDAYREKGIKVYAAHLDGNKRYYEINYPDKMAVLIGNEGNGLTDEIMKHVDCRVQIPMEGKVESLNAAMAAGILMYHSHYIK